MRDFHLVADQFNQTLDTWTKEVKRYSYHQICTQPAVNSWSIGQLVKHIIEETFWYLEQIDGCLNNPRNNEKEMIPEVKAWFLQNSFPDTRLKGPPDLPNPDQPVTKKSLLEELDTLKVHINATAKVISESLSIGKMQHPGHGFLNAKEWFQYAEMHMRHHLRQKERIDKFLSEQ